MSPDQTYCPAGGRSLEPPVPTSIVPLWGTLGDSAIYLNPVHRNLLEQRLLALLKLQYSCNICLLTILYISLIKSYVENRDNKMIL